MNVSGLYPGPEYKRALIDVSAGGTTTIVAAVAGKKIRLKYIDISCSSAVYIGWYEDKAGVPAEILPAQPYDQYGGKIGSHIANEETYVCETSAVNKSLDIYLSGASTVRGYIWYQET